ncbi:hypothetical protein ACH5RR_018406, partial [Cinchona calisaya]
VDWATVRRSVANCESWITEEDFRMEHEWEDDVHGDVPEFGAIFMSNIATKRECFKQKVFALPSSMVNFVKQVKEGMVLFLFEFEKRQLFGVYQATSDGAINITPHAFNFSGKHFPAQVRFAPIWSCRPLFENEFREAIRENYFSAKKFHFGLSEQQVRRLLQLFSTRKVNDKLPPRQMTRIVSRLADCGSYAIRERLELEHHEDDFTPADMDEFLDYTPDRTIEDEKMLFIEDRLENEKKMNTFGHNFLADQADDFLHKGERFYDNKAETELHNTRAVLLSYGTVDKERIPATCCRSLRAENIDKDCNIYSSLSPAIVTKYTGGTSDLTRRADYERPLFQGANRHGINDDRFLMNDTIKNNLNLHGSFRSTVSNENEDDLGRPGSAAGDCSFSINSRSGYKYNINDDIDPVVPSENFDDSLHRVKGPSGNSKLSLGERIASEHSLDNRLRLDILSEKHQNPFDGDQRRFLHRDEVTKANYRDGVHGSTISYVPSGYYRSIPRQTADDGLLNKSRVDNRNNIDMFLRPVSTKYTAFPLLEQNSLDCFSKPAPDNQFSQVEGQQHFKNLNSTFQNSIVTRTVPSASELTTFHHGHSLPIGVDRGASVPLDNPHYDSVGNLLTLSKSKFLEREGFGGYKYASEFGNENFYASNRHISHFHTAEIPQSIELKSSAAANDWDLVFSPSTFGSLPLTEAVDLCSWKKSSLNFDHHSLLSQGMQNRIYWQENDERVAGNEAPSSNLGVYHREEHLTDDAVEFYKRYNTVIENDDSKHFLNRGGGYSDFEKQRRSVFTRLTSTPRLCTWEEKEKGADVYMDKSVDEVMDILNSSQNIWMKNLRKCKPVVRQHNREELQRTDKRISPDLPQPRFTTIKLGEASQTIEEGVDELPKETRAVEFKRRSELMKHFGEHSTKKNVLSMDSTSKDIHYSTSRENAEPEGLVNKPQKRRKLVRPVFSNNVSADGVGVNQSLLSQSQ